MDTANDRRRMKAAARTVAALTDLLAHADDKWPPHLVAAARLRVAHPTASLRDLGEMAQPPVTKDVMSSRLRRLAERAARNGR